MTTPDRQIWTDMLAHLQGHHPDLCRHWFEELDPILFDAGTLSIRAQSEVHRDYLRRHTLDAFNDAVRTVTQQLVSVRFLGPQDPMPEIAPQPRSSQSKNQSKNNAKHAGRPAANSAGRSAGLAASHSADATPVTASGSIPTGTTNSAKKGDQVLTDDRAERSALGESKAGQQAHQSATPPPNGVLGSSTPASAPSTSASAHQSGDPATPDPGKSPSDDAAGQTHADRVTPNTQHHQDTSDHQAGSYQPQSNSHAGAAGELDPMVEPKPRRPQVSPAGGSEAALADHPDALNINPDHTFDNFVVGPANRVATAAAQAVGERPGDAYNPLFIHGGVGLGKTHLLQSICLRVLEHSPNAVIYYLSCEAFVTQFVDAIRAGEMSDFRHRYRDVDILVIDDIHFLTGHDRTQEEFFHTFNSLYQARKQIVLSSDAPPEEIPDLEERLVSRFKWGLVAEMKTPDFETRTAIVQTKAKLRGLTFPTDVAAFIAERVHRNVRELEGAITTIQIRAQIDKREINLDLAREAMGDAPAPVVVQPTLGQITDAVTRYYNVKVTDLQSRRRHKSVSLPRQVCMYLARKKTRYSLEEIGGFYGGRDHTTVMHAVKTITERSSTETDLVAALNNIEQGLD